MDILNSLARNVHVRVWEPAYLHFGISQDNTEYTYGSSSSSMIGHRDFIPINCDRRGTIKLYTPLQALSAARIIS